jgi:hypothetical protein
LATAEMNDRQTTDTKCQQPASDCHRTSTTSEKHPDGSTTSENRPFRPTGAAGSTSMR